MLTSSNCSMHTSLREGVVQPMGLHVGTCLPGRGQPAARLGDFLSLWSSKAASERLLPCTLRAGPFLRNSSDASTSGLHRNYLHFNTMHDYPGSGSLSLSLSLSVSLSLSLSLSALCSLAQDRNSHNMVHVTHIIMLLTVCNARQALRQRHQKRTRHEE